MIDNRPLTADEWQCIGLVVVVVLFVLGVILKRLTGRLRRQLVVLEKSHRLLDTCPFCGRLPEVRNGSFLCKSCKLTMYVPLRRYASVKDMVDRTWNRRVSR